MALPAMDFMLELTDFNATTIARVPTAPPAIAAPNATTTTADVPIPAARPNDNAVKAVSAPTVAKAPDDTAGNAAPINRSPAPATVRPAPRASVPAARSNTPAAAIRTAAPTNTSPAPTTTSPAPRTMHPAPATAAPAPNTIMPAPRVAMQAAP